MANISEELSNIKNAIYGKDVRSSIHNGIDAINKETEITTEKQNILGEQFKDLVINAGNSNAEVAASRGSHDWLPDRLDDFDSQMETNTKNIVSISVKNFGAKCDGVTDDTVAIKNALSSEHKIITIDGDCKISSTLTIPKNKHLIVKGSFIVSETNFNGTKVIHITDNYEGLNIDNLSIITESFYNKDRHLVSNTIRTNFDGVVITNSRRVTLTNIKIVGITTRPLVIDGGYETHIEKADIWGSNLRYSVLDNYEDKLMFTSQNERYTIGVVANCNDSIFNNIVCVGFNVGMSVNSANVVNNYHPWGYISDMVYGLVVKGSLNMFSNLYLDTVKKINSRFGAGIYEWKLADGNINMSTEYNKYNNITAYKFDNDSVVVELGDEEKVTASYMTQVTNISPDYQIKLYKLNGKSKGNPLLERRNGVNFSSYCTKLSNFNIDTVNGTFNNIISSVVEQSLQTYFDGMMSSISFVDSTKVLTSKLPTTSSLYNQQAVFKIESYSNKYYRCTVTGYGYPNSNTYILDMFRNEIGSYDFYSSNLNVYRVQDWLPNQSDYGVGSQIFYKNKPIWKTSSNIWIYADGTQAL